MASIPVHETQAVPTPPAELSPPWMEPTAFAEAPVPGTYGYYRSGWTFDCSQERLVGVLTRDTDKLILLVWTPESMRLAPPEEHSWLWEALRTREIEHLKKQRHGIILNMVMFGLLAIISQSRASSFFLIVTFATGILPFAVTSWKLLQLQRLNSGGFSKDIVDARFRAWAENRPTRWTWALLSCLSVIAFAQYLVLPWVSTDAFGRTVENAGIVKDAVRAGELWRLLTGTLLHGHPFHLFFNLVALVSLSQLTEKILRGVLLPLVFFVSALTGSIFSLVLIPDLDSVGSSGGIMGLLGFLLTASLLHRWHFPPSLGRSLTMGLMVIAGIGLVAHDLIDNAAHLGGLVAGAALGWIIGTRGETLQSAAASSWAVAAGIASYFGVTATTLLCVCKLFSDI